MVDAIVVVTAAAQETDEGNDINLIGNIYRVKMEK